MDRSFYQEKPNGLVLTVRVQPRASADRVEGVVEGHLKLRLTAPPVEGEANAAAVALVAAWLGVPRSRVALVGGQTGRVKRLQVTGDPEALRRALEARLG